MRYQEQMSHKIPPSKSNLHMPEQTPPVDGNDNINPPPIGDINKGVVYIDDDVLPHYEYVDKGNSVTKTEGSYLGSKESNTWDLRSGVWNGGI